MDVQTLVTLFTTTFSGDVNTRRAAELEIRRVGNEEGMISALMQIIANNAIDVPTRQACVVWLKNRVHRAYKLDQAIGETKTLPIPASDRQAIKQHIIPLLVTASSRSIRVQLTACVKTVIGSDFPDEWPGLVDQVVNMIQSEDLPTIYAGLLVNLEIMKSYKYKTTKEEKSMGKIIERVFPILVTLGDRFVTSSPVPPADAAEYLHVIVKTYQTSINSCLSKHQQSHASIVPWGRLFFQVINMQLPPGESLPGDHAEWEKHPWWKAKKWAYRTCNRLFERYGSPTHIPQSMRKEYNAFSSNFITTFAPEIFNVYLHQIELYIGSQAWLSGRSLNLITNFFGFCIRPKSTWTMLKPHAQTLVSRLVFPQLRFDQEKMELYSDDPVEYVRITNEEFEDYSSPRSAAVNFLLTLAQTRAKSEFMPILEFVNHVLKESPAPEDKYAALNMIVALAAVIMRNDDVKPAMETFLMTFVFPEFQSPVGFLREIACQVVGSLSAFTMEWKDPKNHEATFRALVGALDDPDLPVRVQAALSLGETLGSEDVRRALIPGIEKIMQDLFKLSDETDLDALSGCMETFIEAFDEQLLPVSPQLIARLCQSYVRVLGEQAAKFEGEVGLDDEQDLTKVDSDDKTFTLMGIAKTITTVLGCFEDTGPVDPKVLEIQELITPVILDTLRTNVVELYDTAWELVDAVTFRARAIVPSLWPAFELSHTLFKSSAVDYLEEMLPGLCNFMLFGRDRFIQNPKYIEMAVDIFLTSLSHDHLTEHDAVNGFKIAEGLLLGFKGHVDTAIPRMLLASVEKYSKAEVPMLKVAALNGIVAAIYSNPVLALTNLENSSPGSSRAFFDKWFAVMAEEEGLPRVHDKKLSILTLCELMKVDPAAIPPPLKEGWVGIISGILAIFKGLPEAEDRRSQLLEQFEDEEEEGSEDEDDMDEDFGHEEEALDDDGDIYDEETAYLDLLAAEGARLRAKQAKRLAKAARKAGLIEADAEGEDEDEGSEYHGSAADSEDSVAEDFGIETPIDDVDPYAYFKETLTNLQSTNPGFHQAMTTSLTADQQLALGEVMAHEEETETVVVPSS